MDPATAVGLASSCLGIITKIVSTGKQLDTFVKNFRSAPKDIIRLSEQLSIFQEVLAQLEAWLNQQPDISLSMSSTIKKSLTASTVIIEDIHSHVLNVSPKPGEDSIGFWRRIRHLWAEDDVKEHERMISSQFQIFTMLISLTPIAKYNVDSIVQDEPNRELLKRGQADAQSILSAKDSASRFGQITIDDDLGLDQELSIDAEITQTGPYLQNYRNLVHRLKKTAPDATPDLNSASSSSRTNDDTSPVTSLRPRVSTTPIGVPKLDAKATSGHGPRKSSGSLSHWAQMKFSKQYRLQEEKVAQLCVAAAQGGFARMEALIKHGADVNGRNRRDAGPLETALIHGQVEAVRILLGAGADANIPMKDDKNKATGITKPLHLALSMGSVEIVQLLIDHGADPHSPGIDGDTPLHKAVGETVSPLLSFGADVHAKNSLGEQPLVSAVSRGDLIAVKKLLSRGAPVNDQSDKTSLWVDSRGPIKKSPYTPGTPLLMSMLDSSLEVTQLLIAAGADVHQLYQIHTPSKTEATADLFWIICRGYIRREETHFNSDLAKVLLENGANPVRICSFNYHTALEELCGPTENTIAPLEWASIRSRPLQNDHPGRLSILRMICQIAPQYISVNHSSGRHLLVGIWHDFIEEMMRAGDYQVKCCVYWIDLVVSASLILLQSETPLLLTDVDKAALLHEMDHLKCFSWAPEHMESLFIKLAEFNQ